MAITPDIAGPRLPGRFADAWAIEGTHLFGNPCREKVGNGTEAVWFWQGGPLAVSTIAAFRWMEARPELFDAEPTAVTLFEHAGEKCVVWCRVGERQRIVDWPEAIQHPVGWAKEAK